MLLQKYMDGWTRHFPKLQLHAGRLAAIKHELFISFVIQIEYVSYVKSKRAHPPRSRMRFLLLSTVPFV